jgi:hypothetical protein
MRSDIFVKGLVLLVVGGVLIAFGILTGTSEAEVTSADIFGGSYPYGFLGSHEYRATTSLLPGTYELCYDFSSNETVREFYVNVIDPDGYAIESVYGPPTMYQNQSANLNFETQKTGQHTFILGGRWESVQLNLYRLTQSIKTVYPYEIALYFGLVLLTVGVIVSISGAVMKEKLTYWLDSL